MSAFAEDRPKEAHTLKELYTKGYKIKQGEWRMALASMAERIMGERNEDGTDKPGPINGKHPEPKNPVLRAAYRFLKSCETGEINYIRELANRLDGLPKQAVEVSDADGNAVPIQMIQLVALTRDGDDSQAPIRPH